MEAYGDYDVIVVRDAESGVVASDGIVQPGGEIPEILRTT
jgi:hypothetical protein